MKIELIKFNHEEKTAVLETLDDAIFNMTALSARNFINVSSSDWDILLKMIDIRNKIRDIF